MPAGQELIEHKTQLVDVGRRGDELAAHLLGARVLGGQDAQPGAGQPAGGHGRRLVQDSRDSEIEQFHLVLGGHQDVRRLDVAVHDHGPVGVGHRPGGVDEQPQPLLHPQPVLVAESVDGEALDVLHRQKGPAVIGDSTVEVSCDTGVVERREDRSLLIEPEHRVL